MKVWKLAWKFGDLELHALGGMVSPRFVLSTGIVEPLCIAPWVGDPVSMRNTLPPILQNMRGEWPCVPFGASRKVEGMPSNWDRVKYEITEGEPHGFSSNNEWTLVKQTAHSITIQCLYPDHSPVQKLVRVVRPDPHAPKVDFELHVIVKRNVSLPIGLHPIVDTSGGGVILKPGQFKFGMVFPGYLEPSSIAAPGSQFESLQHVPLIKGGVSDFSRLPRKDNTENLIQLCGIDGTFEAIINSPNIQSGKNSDTHNEYKTSSSLSPSRYITKLKWDSSHFPSVILWQSNRGRPAYPWSDRFLGCGIEPVCAAFDLGTHVSTHANPINQQGVRTAVDFKANHLWTTKYSIEVSAANDSKL